MISKHLLIILSAPLLLLACADAVEKEPEPVVNQTTDISTGQAMSSNDLPAFTMQDVSGNVVTMQNLKGKKLFVNLWASWCPPCKREMPSIEKLYKSADTSKASFVLLSLDDDFDKAKKYITSAKLQLPVYYPAENLPSIFNVQSIPTTFLFDENGKLLKRIEGAENYNTDEYRNILK